MYLEIPLGTEVDGSQRPEEFSSQDVKDALAWFKLCTDQALQDGVGHEEVEKHTNSELFSEYIDEAILSLLGDFNKSLSQGEQLVLVGFIEKFKSDPVVIFKLNNYFSESLTKQLERFLRDQIDRFRVLVETYQRLQEARKGILQIAPSLAPVLEKIMSKLLFATSWQSQSKVFQYFRINSVHIISVPRQNADGSHYQVHRDVHELLHAVLFEYLNLLDLSTTSADLVTYMNKDISILRVIAEGISLVFEREFIKNQINAKNNSNQSEFLPRQLRAIAGNRGAYREGMRIALILRKNGWTPNDLLQLLDFLQEKMSGITVEGIGRSFTGLEILQREPFIIEEGEVSGQPQYSKMYLSILKLLKSLEKP